YHLILDDNRKPARIREEADLNLLQFSIWILNDRVHPGFARSAGHQCRARFHLRGDDVEITLAVHAMHVDVVALVIKNVDADRDPLSTRQAFTGFGETLSRR